MSQIERTRLAVEAAVHELEQLAQYEPSRGLSLAITNAQQAAMWHGWHEGEKGRYVNPFPTAAHQDDDEWEDEDADIDDEEFPFATGGIVPVGSMALPALPEQEKDKLGQHTLVANEPTKPVSTRQMGRVITRREALEMSTDQLTHALREGARLEG